MLLLDCTVNGTQCNLRVYLETVRITLKAQTLYRREAPPYFQACIIYNRHVIAPVPIFLVNVGLLPATV